MSFKMRALAFYRESPLLSFRHYMENHPVASNCFLSLSLWVVGDLLAQRSEHSRHSTTKDGNGGAGTGTSSFTWDWKRTAKCAGFGGLVTGPILAVWYPYLDRLCLKHQFAVRFGIWGPPVAKVAADEFLMDPPTLALFFGYMNHWEGGTVYSFWHKMKTEFWMAWSTSLIAWPPILLGTFRFLPVYAQAPVINVCCIVWDGFLSHRNEESKRRRQQQ